MYSTQRLVQATVIFHLKHADKMCNGQLSLLLLLLFLNESPTVKKKKKIPRFIYKDSYFLELNSLFPFFSTFQLIFPYSSTFSPFLLPSIFIYLQHSIFFSLSMAHSSFSNMLLNNSDDDEIIIKYLMKEGSSSQCDTVQCRYIERDHLQGHKRLFLDYFAKSPVYPPNIFRRRFQMRRSLFLRIQSAVEGHDDYFIQKKDNA
jgi:hypothetical protein